MLTREAYSILTVACALLVASFFLVSLASLVASITMIAYLALGYLASPPKVVSAVRTLSKASAKVGEEVEVRVDLKVEGGLGLLVVADEVEGLAVEGSNVRAYWIGPSRRSLSLSYKVKCVRRGVYGFKGVLWESRNAFGVRRYPARELKLPSELTVKPRLFEIRRVRGLRSLASSPFPAEDLAKVGVRTTDFKEVREYEVGDPVKAINWKATARLWPKRGKPLVNEYEVEGRKAVFIFLDCSEAMEVGAGPENVLEYALEAVSAVAYFYLSRGYRVGFYAYNDHHASLYPDVGKAHYGKLVDILLTLKASSLREGLLDAVEACRRYLLLFSPLTFVVTRVREGEYADLSAGIRKLTKWLRRKGKGRVVVLDVDPYSLITGDPAVKGLAYLRRLKLLEGLRAKGAILLSWDPKRVKLSSLLMRYVGR